MTDTNKPDISREAVERLIAVCSMEPGYIPNSKALLLALREELDKYDEFVRLFLSDWTVSWDNATPEGTRMFSDGTGYPVSGSIYRAARRLKQGE